MEKASRCDSRLELCILLLLTALCVGAVPELQLLDFDLRERTPLVLPLGVSGIEGRVQMAREALCPSQQVG